MKINKSLLNNIWLEKEIDPNLVEKLSQKKSIPQIFSKLLVARGIDEKNFENFLQPNITSDIPNPYHLKDMKKSVDRSIEALKKRRK